MKMSEVNCSNSGFHLLKFHLFRFCAINYYEKNIIKLTCTLLARHSEINPTLYSFSQLKRDKELFLKSHHRMDGHAAIQNNYQSTKYLANTFTFYVLIIQSYL